MSDNLVLTPGGYRDASLVHHVPPGTTLTMTEGRLQHIKDDGTLIADYGLLQNRAAGRPLHPLNVSQHPDVDLTFDKTVLQGRPLPKDTVVPAFGSGWITYTSWTNSTGTPVSLFSTTWTVPPAPTTNNGQVVFLFNGIQNSTMIYQPVLQWGPSAAGGGPKWSVASWYADGQTGHSFHSSLVDVSVGQVLTGVMTLTGQNGALFDYGCVFTGIAGTSLPVSGIEQLTWCIETLEAYGITTPSDYPDTFDTAMRSIDLMCGTTHPTLTWLVTNAVTDTGQHTVVVNNSTVNGEVDICYRASGLVSPIMPGHAEVNAVSRSADHLDVFCTDSGQSILTAAWEPDFSDWWHGWWSLNGGRAAAGAPVHGVSRSTDKLDVFVVGTDNRVYTAAWEPDFTDWWHGWWPVLGGVAAPGAHVTAVSRSTDKLDIFVVGTDGGVYTAAWEPDFADGWHSWWRIGTIVVPQGAMIGAVVRSADHLDIFVTDIHGAIQTAAWEPDFADGWHGWWQINGGAAAPGSPVHAVSRSTDKLDIFATDIHGAIQTAAWEPDFADGWHGWWQINGGAAAPGAPVTAVSRSTDHLDIFVVGTNSRVYTAAWEPDFTDWWHGWWRMGA